jgi:hypothetical protein
MKMGDAITPSRSHVMNKTMITACRTAPKKRAQGGK